VTQSDRAAFDSATRQELLRLHDLASRAILQKRSGYGHVTDPTGSSDPKDEWTRRALPPGEEDLDASRCADPAPNRVKGSYRSAAEYIGVHFSLLREDFIRPLREAVEAVRRGEEPPRGVRLWPAAMLVESTVGEPGGVLHRVRLASDSAEAEELDLGQGKTLMNGTMLLLSSDGFRTHRCAVVARREAARALGDGSVYVSLTAQDPAACRVARHAAHAAQEASEIASFVGVRFAAMEAGAYWGAYASRSRFTYDFGEFYL
jgi:hypothetical protein